MNVLVIPAAEVAVLVSCMDDPNPTPVAVAKNAFVLYPESEDVRRVDVLDDGAYRVFHSGPQVEDFAEYYSDEAFR